MSNIATYTFLPWLRSGIANKIASADMDTNVKLRATVKVEITIDGIKPDGNKVSEQVSKDVQLYGPGDIIGIDEKAIVKVDPHNWITNFESNYLPYIEFYDEDFPWRYTPAIPDIAKDRLRPWIMLVVLKDGDFAEAKNIKDKPLSYITVDNAITKFPLADQLWAWAHVHVNGNLMDKIVAGPSDRDSVVSKFESILSANPDHASSRILCPVKLESNTAYHAFLIPSFETGRRAGLGLNKDKDAIPADVFATLSAWADYAGKEEPGNFPYYHRWYFRTGSIGDFEYLVRLLQPKPVDMRVGRKDIDVQYPGSNLRGITDESLGGILKLGGALRIPFDTLEPADKQNVTKYENWDQPAFPHPFQKDLAEFINLADNYTVKSSVDANSTADLPAVIKDDCDPLITAPLYGRWHSLMQRLLTERDGTAITPVENWVHELNLDPRWRIAAGYGTKVVQENQEDYMSAAWQQVGDILEANRKMRLAQLAKITSASWYVKQLEPLVQKNPEKGFQFMAPLHNRVVNQGLTIHYQMEKSVLSKSVVSMPVRKILRNGGRVMKKLSFDNTIRPDNLLMRLNEGKIVIVPPKVIAPSLPSLEQLANELLPKNIPPAFVSFFRNFSRFKWIILGLIVVLIIILLTGIPLLFMVLAGIVTISLIALFVKGIQGNKQIKMADSVKEENQTPASVDELPKTDFKLTAPGDGFIPSKGNADSAEAIKYKTALKDAFTLIQESKSAGKIIERNKVDIPNMVAVTFKAIDPEVTIPKLIYNSILIPERIKIKMTEVFTEAMAYPEIDAPMYKPLVTISSELFLPNINHIGQNTISLLETNQRFIESYMVGLNHEFSRELLWREYPTDQRGSYFRQFWDVSSFFDQEGLENEVLKEKLRDIPPLHRWSKNSNLGDHDNREIGGSKEEEIVLVVRGELLKKYPNAVIYAQKAQWQLNDDGSINNKVERELIKLNTAEENNPPGTKVKTPLYEAKVDPDIYFFGFDLTALEAKGGSGESDSDINKAGWFFCIKERPGEARYGLDIDPDTTPNVWNDLSWQDVLPGAGAGSFIQINNSTPSIALRPLDISDNEKEEQRADDDHVSWNKDMNAAEVAYILYQVPVLVAVHASEMLPK